MQRKFAPDKSLGSRKGCEVCKGHSGHKEVRYRETRKGEESEIGTGGGSDDVHVHVSS